MNDTSIYAMSPAQQLEIETLRDQRDLYRSLLLSEPNALGVGLNHALASVEQLRELLRVPTRDSAAFRGKIEQLLAELEALTGALMPLHLPTISSRLGVAQSALREIEHRTEITGNDLLPAMVVLGDLCSHITIAADCASVHVPLIDGGGEAAAELEASQRRAQPKLAVALQQLTDKLAADQGKHVTLVTLGLQEIPEQWISALFDMLGQLVRNAIEHGIESPERRASLTKPEQGTVVVEFIDRESEGFELNVQDDGGGLDAAGITEIAVRKGLLTADSANDLEPAKLASLIFHPGISTARDAARRGQGMQIVRDHVNRLGGRIKAATKNARYTRFRIHLPALAQEQQREGARA
jgi:two-component system, chemotaxis family, sensor kinase CheA